MESAAGLGRGRRNLPALVVVLTLLILVFFAEPFGGGDPVLVATGWSFFAAGLLYGSSVRDLESIVKGTFLSTVFSLTLAVLILLPVAFFTFFGPRTTSGLFPIVYNSGLLLGTVGLFSPIIFIVIMAGAVLGGSLAPWVITELGSYNGYVFIIRVSLVASMGFLYLDLYLR